MSGASVGQESTTAWSSLSVNDIVTLTVAVGDRAAVGGTTWADQSFVGLTDGRATGTFAAGTLISGTVANSGELAAPPTGIDAETMGNVVVSYTVKASDLSRTGNIGVVLASYGAVGTGNGLDPAVNQSLCDNVQLSVVPEPGALGMIGATGVGLLIIRRRFLI